MTQIFSFAEHEWLKDKFGDRIEFLVAPPDNDIFNGKYYMNQLGQKYFLSIYPTGIDNDRYEVYKLWFDDKYWNVSSELIYKNDFSTKDQSYELRVVNEDIDINEIPKGIENGLLKYLHE